MGGVAGVGVLRQERARVVAHARRIQEVAMDQLIGMAGLVTLEGDYTSDETMLHVWDTSDAKHPSAWSCVTSIPSIIASSSSGAVVVSGRRVACTTPHDDNLIAVGDLIWGNCFNIDKRL